LGELTTCQCSPLATLASELTVAAGLGWAGAAAAGGSLLLADSSAAAEGCSTAAAAASPSACSPCCSAASCASFAGEAAGVACKPSQASWPVPCCVAGAPGRAARCAAVGGAAAARLGAVDTGEAAASACSSSSSEPQPNCKRTEAAQVQCDLTSATTGQSGRIGAATKACRQRLSARCTAERRIRPTMQPKAKRLASIVLQTQHMAPCGTVQKQKKQRSIVQQSTSPMRSAPLPPPVPPACAASAAGTAHASAPAGAGGRSSASRRHRTPQSAARCGPECKQKMGRGPESCISQVNLGT